MTLCVEQRLRVFENNAKDNGLADSAVHISGFHGEDGSIVELNTMSLVDTVFSYGRLVRIIQSYVPLMLFYPV
jgi:hypothetical protein